MRVIILALFVFWGGCSLTDGGKEAVQSNHSDTNKQEADPTITPIPSISKGTKVSYPLEKLMMVNENTGWAMLKEGKIIYTKDGWETFQDRTPERMPKRENIQDFLVINDKSAWVYFNKGESLEGLVTSDSGQTWSQQSFSGVADLSVAASSFSDDKTGWLYTSFNHEVHGPQPHELFRTEDGGLSWNQLAKKGLNTSSYKWIYLMDQTKGWSIGENVKSGTDYIDPTTTALFATEDGGQTWVSHSLIKTVEEQGIDYQAPQFFNGTGMLSGVQFPLNRESGDVKLYTFQYTAETSKWSLTGMLEFPFKRDLQAGPLPFFKSEAIRIGFVNIEDGWLLTNNEIYTTTNGGESWSKGRDTSAFPSTENVQFITLEIGYAFDQATLYKTTDGGISWVPIVGSEL
ncbi:MAG: hypothetical protein K6T85_00850 [Gorillibacterium sp.]|nr:hypothetical protein [Gorillibacterium sp.]